MLTILVMGSNGQLGSEFIELSKASPYQFIFCDKTDADITSKSSLKQFLKDKSVDVILNCAAYTAVDKAEDEEEKAFQINHIGVKNIVEICQDKNIKLIHFSTDYVFNGKNHKPYTEFDKVSPESVYGKSKFAGEKEIMKSDISALVIRTSWLYSNFGQNFVKNMLRLGSQKKSIGVVFDQIGTPTSAKDLAHATLNCLSQLSGWEGKQITYHFSNEGVASWYDFTIEIFKHYNINCEVNPIMSKDFPTKAKRPHFSVLDKTYFKESFNFKIQHWKCAFINTIFNNIL